MHHRTLLYSALGFTALATIYGVVKGTREHVPPLPSVAISPIASYEAERIAGPEQVPIRLTASDGTGLTLVSLAARAAVEDPLALTELHLVFENPRDTTLEGTFRIALPQGASLSRFAMKTAAGWQEGEVVEKQAARRAYEDFLHRKQDPALLEQAAGNEFSARVFPIAPRERKEIKIAYSEVLEAGAPYTLPLRGLPELGELDIDVSARGARAASGKTTPESTFTWHERKYAPTRDFSVDAKDLPRSDGLIHGELVLARVVPFASSRPEPVSSAVVLVDTSASRALGLNEQVGLLERMLRKLPSNTRVSVACFDQAIKPVFEGNAGAFSQKEARAILDRGALGASNIQAAMVWAGSEARRLGAKRVVLLGDGVATAGETDAQKLRSDVESLRAAGVTRMDAVAIGGIRDDAFLRTLVRGVLDRDGVVLDAKLGAAAIAQRLGESTSSGMPVKVEGARWSWPETLDGLQAGDEVLVVAELDREHEQPVRITIGTQAFDPKLRQVERPLVERAWAQAKIQSLVDAPKDAPAATRNEIVRLSRTHRVLSPETAMLVLESDSDYERFGIDRRATVDILTVEDGRISVTHHPRPSPTKPPVWEDFPRFPRARAPAAAHAAGPRTDSALVHQDLGASPSSGTGANAGDDAPSLPNAPADTPSSRGEATAGATPAVSERKGATSPDNAAAPPPRPRADVSALVTEESSKAVNMPPAEPTARHPRGHGDGEGASPAPAASSPHSEIGRAIEPFEDVVTSQGHAQPPGPLAPRTRTAPRDGQVRAATLTVEPPENLSAAQASVRAAIPSLRACYIAALNESPNLRGRIEFQATLDELGGVRQVDLTAAPTSDVLRTCGESVFKTLRFASPRSKTSKITASFDLVPRTEDPAGRVAEEPTTEPKRQPYEGRFRDVMDRLERHESDAALQVARAWHQESPGDIMALVALGEALEARGDLDTAARAYGSILELFTNRADLRRFAGERLERLKNAAALALATDTYAKAVEQRPDHPASHRLYAFALLKQGAHERAFLALTKGLQRPYPEGRFAGVTKILREDLGLVAAAWQRAQPDNASTIRVRLADVGGTPETTPSLRFVLNWETDANDVDFHIFDARGNHAYYRQRTLPSGGELYADVTTGYGPECFTVRVAPDRRAGPYKLEAHYFARGPMGYGMGKLQIIDHDGRGGLTFEERPYVVMADKAFVDLGVVSNSPSDPARTWK